MLLAVPGWDLRGRGILRGFFVNVSPPPPPACMLITNEPINLV